MTTTDERACAAADAATGAPPPPLLQVVCFSMDRVFQLSEYLRTLVQYVRYRGAHWPSTTNDPADRISNDSHAPPFARVAVICRCSTPEIRLYYEQIAQRYAQYNVTFVYESPSLSFADCLLLSLSTGGQRSVRTTNTPCPYVLFNVDDAFYFDVVELADAIAFLDGEASASFTPFAFHVKLAPSIWRSHLTNQPMLPLPPMQTVTRRYSNSSMATDSDYSQVATSRLEPLYHVFEPARGVLDWNYPWELSGSVYTYKSVERVVAAIKTTYGRAGISHPNHLELRGHQVVQTQTQTQNERLICACSLSPKMHVFAINQVQDKFANRLYGHDTLGGATSTGGDLTNLLQLYLAHESLDERYYRSSRLASVHIGTLVLTSQGADKSGYKGHNTRNTVDATITDSDDTNTLVSVVVPVFNVELYVEQALRSILEQTYTNLEVVVVDDASTDATREIVANLAAQDPRLRLLCNVANVGVAATLNRALAAARGVFIARMDGDDIALPCRIERQLAYFAMHPDVSVVGASVLLLREHTRQCDSVSDTDLDVVQQLETAVYPTSALVTKWRMLFGCFVAHPTVMLRRDALDRALITDNSSDDTSLLPVSVRAWYATSQRSSEDYELWLRCLFGHDLVVQSMGDALVIHRKHAQSASSTQRDQQIRETQEIALKWIKPLAAADSIAATTDDTALGTQLLPLFDANASESVDDLSVCVDALHTLQTRVCASAVSAVSPASLQQAADADELACERAYVSQDAAAREGELALRAMVLDPIRGAQLWSTFAARHPMASRRAFERLFSK